MNSQNHQSAKPFKKLCSMESLSRYVSVLGKGLLDRKTPYVLWEVVNEWEYLFQMVRQKGDISTIIGLKVYQLGLYGTDYLIRSGFIFQENDE
jgi:hypothetical protein